MCTATGDEVGEDDFADVEDKNDLIGKDLSFKMDITALSNLPEDLSTSPFITYSLKYEPNTVNSTDESKGQTTSHNF